MAGGACISGAMCGGGCAWQGGCVTGGHAWQGGVHGRYYEIQSMSRQYASYCNAFL